MAGRVITQWNRVLQSPVLVSADNFAEAVGFFGTRARRNYSDEANEGLALLVKHQRESLARLLFDDFSEVAVEHSLDLARQLPLNSGLVTEKAIRGLPCAVEAVGPQSPFVRELLDGSQLTPIRVVAALENLDTLRGVEGLDRMVRFLRNNRNNANGIDGAIFEGTASRRIIEGHVPGSGVLQGVSEDGLPGLNRIDTLTENWAIQVNSKIDPSVRLGLGDLGSVPGHQYLDEMIQQAQSLDRVPVLISNRQITADLEEALEARSILFRLVE